MGYYSALKRTKLPSHENTGMSLENIPLSERSQSVNATYCVVPVIWHSGECKTMKTANKPVVAKDWRRETEGCRNTVCSTVMVDTGHQAFVGAQRMCDIKSGPYSNLWSLGDYDVFV